MAFPAPFESVAETAVMDPRTSAFVVTERTASLSTETVPLTLRLATVEVALPEEGLTTVTFPSTVTSFASNSEKMTSPVMVIVLSLPALNVPETVSFRN